MLMAEIATYPVLTAAEQIRLARLMVEGSRAARQKLILHNLLLVVNEVLRFRGKHTRAIDALDLFMAGVDGLENALTRFDPDLGWRFSTYATWWIRQAIGREQENSGAVIRQTSCIQVRRMKLRRVRREFLAEAGREPTEAELSALARLTPAQVRLASEPSLDKAYSLDATYNEMPNTAGRRSWNRAGSPDDQGFWADIMADPRAEDDLRAIESDDATGRIMAIARAALGTNSNAWILLTEHAFADVKTRPSLTVLGQRIGLTHERCRQIEAAALVKVRTALAAAGIGPDDLR